MIPFNFIQYQLFFNFLLRNELINLKLICVMELHLILDKATGSSVLNEINIQSDIDFSCYSSFTHSISIVCFNFLIDRMDKVDE